MRQGVDVWTCLPRRLPIQQNLNSSQLSAALQQVQQLQQDQLRMWEDFKAQAQELQQLLSDKQAMAADRDAARAELANMHELLQQQKQLQEAYAAQQRALLELQQQQMQPHQPYAGLQTNVLQAGDDGGWEAENCLDDGFVVETQMVSKPHQQTAPGPYWVRTEFTHVTGCMLASHEACGNTASLTGCMRTVTNLHCRIRSCMLS